MRLLRLTTLLPLFLCALLSTSARTEDWQTFTSNEQSFSISFPGAPTEESSPLPQGPNLYTTSYSGSDNLSRYAVQYLEIPPDAVHSDDPESVQEFFEDFIENVVGSSSEKLLSQTTIGKDGFPGKELHVSLLDGAAIGIFRLYLVESRNYVLAVIVPSDQTHNESIARFFDSFTLLPIPAGTEEWQTFTSKAHGFSIRFPGIPKEETKPLWLGATIDISYYRESQGATPTTYVAQHIKFLAATRISKDSISIANFFDDRIKSTLMKRPGKLLSETIIEKDGFPGRELQISYTDSELIGIVRAYLMWDKAYLLMVAITPEEKDNPKVQQFFDSFTLLK